MIASTTVRRRALLSVAALPLALAGAAAHAQATSPGLPPEPEQPDAATESPDIAVDGIIVTGTRRTDRTVADSPVPIDVISGDQLTDSGYTETNKILNQLVPSFNFPQPSLTDGTDSVRPATLRGLSPDQTLVLVNGKRRHVSALLNLNGSVGRGSAAADLNTITPIAIERIEVLRDGASSQYGSDAIAGVVNVILRRSSGVRAQVTYGQYVTTLAGVADVTGVQTGATGQPLPNPQAGASDVFLLAQDGERERRDGGVLTVATNIGLPVGDAGYLNLTAQYQDRNPTSREGADPRRQYPLVNGNVDPRELTIDRYTHRFGDPRTSDLLFTANAGHDLGGSGAELYGFATFNQRDGESAGFYRRATDARNRDFSASTTSFVPFYPDGFLPLITTDIRDVAAAGGVRGQLDNGLRYDASVSYGTNRFGFGVENTFNTSLGQQSPRQVDAGSLNFGQTVVNLDLQKLFDIGIGDGLSIAVGAEYRDENFRIKAGELASYVAGPFAASPFNAPAGAQVFPGFRPSNEVDASRDSYAGYAELEIDPVDGLTVQLAGRYEDFSDFGDTVNGKAAVRFEPIDGFAVRGSVATGFRAPSLQQQFYATSSTNNVNGTLVEIGTFPVSSPVARALGSQPLKPENALNLSGGLTASPIPGLLLTADYYNIRLRDRVVVTENLQGAGVVSLLRGAGFNNVTSARFFVNGIDTRTQGVELVGTYRLPDLGIGNLRLTAGYSYNETKILRRAVLPTLPGLALFGRQESLRLTDGQPKDKLNLGLDYDRGIVGVSLRGNRFGEVLVPGVDAPRDQVLGGKWLADAELRVQAFEQLELAVGANNVFDEYPDTVRAGIVDGQNYGLNGYFLPYSSFSPFGFNGRFLYGRVSIGF